MISMFGDLGLCSFFRFFPLLCFDCHCVFLALVNDIRVRGLTIIQFSLIALLLSIHSSKSIHLFCVNSKVNVSFHFSFLYHFFILLDLPAAITHLHSCKHLLYFHSYSLRIHNNFEYFSIG